MEDKSPNGTSPVLEVNSIFRGKYNMISQAWNRGEIDFAMAVSNMEALRAEARSLENPDLQQGALEMALGILYGYRSDYDASVTQFERARELFAKAGAEREIIRCELNIGETYRLRGNFTRARSSFHQAYENAQRLGIRSVSAIALGNEGQVWLAMGSPDRARFVIEKALRIAENPWSEDGKEESESLRSARQGFKCEAHSVLSAVLLSLGLPERAWQEAKHAHEVASSLDQWLRTGFANRALGGVLTVLDGVPLADVDRFVADPDHYYQCSLDAFKVGKSEGEYAKTLYDYGKSLVQRKRLRSAGQKFQQAMVIFTRLGMTHDAALAAEAQLLLY